MMIAIINEKKHLLDESEHNGDRGIAQSTFW